MFAKEVQGNIVSIICILFALTSFVSYSAVSTSQIRTHSEQDVSLKEKDDKPKDVVKKHVLTGVTTAQSNEHVQLTTGASYYPFISASLPQGGWSQALVTAIFAEMGYQADIHILPWSRGEMWTDEQRFLGTFPYVYSPTREKKYLYSHPINFITVRFYVNKASNITQVQQLKNKRLCLPYGYSDKFVKGGVVDSLNLTINRVVDGAACIGHVQRGWSDAGLTNTYVSVNEITNTRLIDRELRIINADVEKVPLHFVISVSYPDAQTWMDNFNQAFYRITQNGVKAEIDNTFIQLIETL